MIKNLYFVGLIMLSPMISYAQVGINTSSPNSTLDIKGSVSMSYLNSRTYQNSIESYYVGVNNHYFVFDGDKDGTLQLKDESGPVGRLYRIKNGSPYKLTISPETSTNTFRVNNTLDLSSFTVNPGDYVEIVRSKVSGSNSWDVSYITRILTNENSSITLFGAKLNIPPLRLNATYVNDETTFPTWDYSALNATVIEVAGINSQYSTTGNGGVNDKWVLIKKALPPTTPFQNKYPNSSGSSANKNIFKIVRSADTNNRYVQYISPSKVILTYEYQGTAFNNINNIYPLLTAGNSSTNPYVFQTTIQSIQNVVTTTRGTKTRIVVVVSRMDFFGRKSASTDPYGSDWSSAIAGSSFINLLITN